MAIPSRQIGWSTQSNLLWQISKELERLICVTAGGCSTTTTTTTLPFVWTFIPSESSVFPANSDGYTLYTGAWTFFDDGQTVDSFPLGGGFSYNDLVNNVAHLSTNGYMILDNGLFDIIGNGGDLFLTPGDSLNDGDTQNFWYQSTGDLVKWKTSMLIYCGYCCGTINQETPYSYIINIYRDANFQYIETCSKTNIADNTGPGTNATSPSTATQVWQSDLNGTTWTLLGYGSVI